MLQRPVELCLPHAGEVYCYAEGTKPPQGEGLNCPAEITLYNVYRKDRDTGEMLKSGPKAEKFSKALQGMCAQMGAKFGSYKLDGGVWKFDVSVWHGAFSGTPRHLIGHVM